MICTYCSSGELYGAGRLSSSDNNTTPNLPHVVLTNFYNAANWRFGLTSTVNGTADFTNTYNFDNIGRMNNLSQSGTGIAQKRVDIAYNQSGQYSKITRSSTTGSITEVSHSDYGYDLANRLTSLAHKKPDNSPLVTAYSWTPDNADRVTNLTNADGSVTYSYDATDQVTVADYSSGVITDEGYSYDSNGNRTGGSYSTSTDNQLTNDGIYTYTYYNEGTRKRRTNISTGSYHEYEWDHRGRLVAVKGYLSSGQWMETTSYAYDMHDRRISKLISFNGAANQSYNEWYNYDGNDLVLVTGSDMYGTRYLKQRYMYGAQDGAAMTEENAATGAVLWLLADEQGSIRDMGDNAGNLVAGSHVIYDSFGNISSGTPGRYAYTGQEYDADTGLYYYNARYYDPKVGRFISQDPIGFEGGDSNLYRYVGNNSVNLEDPTGMNATRLGTYQYSASTTASVVSYGYNSDPGNVGFSIGGMTLTWDENRSMLGPTNVGNFFHNVFEMATHPSATGTVMKIGAQNALESFVEHEANVSRSPVSANAGRVLGVGNAAVGTLTGLGNLKADSENVMGAWLSNAVMGREQTLDELEGINGFEKLNARLPDKVRQEAYEKAVESLKNMGLDERALRAGSTEGEVGFQAAMTAWAVYDGVNLLSALGSSSAAVRFGVASERLAASPSIFDLPPAARGLALDTIPGGRQLILPSLEGNIPDPVKWMKNGGRVRFNADGSMKFTAANGVSVKYSPTGYADFKSAGLVRQEVTFPYKGNYTTDFATADRLAPLGPRLGTNTWHHVEDLRTMQELNAAIHKGFYHSGGLSIIRKQ
jgi:RHS repeat-associated protein